MGNEKQKPMFCPFCGSKANLFQVVEWSAQSKEDADNTAEIDEYQCHSGCAGRSFWA